MVGGVEVKLSLYADDMVLYMADKKSAETAIEVIKYFSEASGLSLNEEKSNLMWLGVSKNRTDPVSGINAKKKIKYLGIYFSATDSCLEENIQPICRKIDTVINIWGQRSLTLKG